MKVCCGIVLFNPNISVLKNNILAIQDQVSQIFIVDNGSKNLMEIKAVVKKCNNISLIANDHNEGIAKALNQLCVIAKKNKYEWILTLDQDSVCPLDYIFNLEKYVNVVPKVGIVSPVIVDRNVGVIGHYSPKKIYQEVKTCITSGALTNLNAWKEVNGFDEKMFIDSVDFDYCYRIRKAGYKILQISIVRLEHSIGEAKKCRFLFWKFNNTEHSAFRAFYIAQNNIYYPKKNKLVLHFIRGNLRNLKYIFIVLLYEKNKISKINSIYKGWKKGLLLKSK